MKKLVGLLLLCTFSFLSAAPNYIGALQKGIEKNQIDRIKNILKIKILSENERQILLARAHENVIAKQAELKYFRHNVGSKRQALGSLLKWIGTINILLQNIGQGGALCVGGYLLSRSGKKAEQRASIEGTINKTKQHETALAIEELIKTAPEQNDTTESKTN